MTGRPPATLAPGSWNTVLSVTTRRLFLPWEMAGAWAARDDASATAGAGPDRRLPTHSPRCTASSTTGRPQGRGDLLSSRHCASQHDPPRGGVDHAQTHGDRRRLPPAPPGPLLP